MGEKCLSFCKFGSKFLHISLKSKDPGPADLFLPVRDLFAGHADAYMPIMPII